MSATTGTRAASADEIVEQLDYLSADVVKISTTFDHIRVLVAIIAVAAGIVIVLGFIFGFIGSFEASS